MATYYKNTSNDLFVFEDNCPSEVVSAKVGDFALTQITVEEYEALSAPSFADVQTDKLRELTAAYVAEITGDVKYNGIVYQGDQKALDALMSRLRIGTEPPYWVAKDNSQTTPFTLVDVEALRSMIDSRAAMAFEVLQERKQMVREAVNVEELQAIVW